jgi:hypothetical protein
LDSGWSRELVEQSLSEFVGVDARGILIPAPSSPSFEIFRDWFLYLLSLLTLLVSATGFLGAAFEVIDKFFPGPRSEFEPGDLSLPMAQMIIGFPVYLWTLYRLDAIVTDNPYKSRSYIRKGLIYVILFVASVTCIGDLIWVLYTLFEGEMTDRTLLRTLVLLTFLGGVIYWYASEINRDNQRLSEIADT